MLGPFSCGTTSWAVFRCVGYNTADILLYIYNALPHTSTPSLSLVVAAHRRGGGAGAAEERDAQDGSYILLMIDLLRSLLYTVFGSPPWCPCTAGTCGRRDEAPSWKLFLLLDAALEDLLLEQVLRQLQQEARRHGIWRRHSFSVEWRLGFFPYPIHASQEAISTVESNRDQRCTSTGLVAGLGCFVGLQIHPPCGRIAQQNLFLIIHKLTKTRLSALLHFIVIQSTSICKFSIGSLQFCSACPRVWGNKKKPSE